MEYEGSLFATRRSPALHADQTPGGRYHPEDVDTDVTKAGEGRADHSHGLSDLASHGGIRTHAARRDAASAASGTVPVGQSLYSAVSVNARKRLGSRFA